MLRIGSRGSALALRQTGLVLDALQRAAPDVHIEVKVIRTEGDEPVSDEEADDRTPTGQGVFVRTIEAALLAGEIDLAVHSFKDMPSAGPAGLTVAAFPIREDPRDVLVTRNRVILADLPAGACIGTGSPRRRALVLAARPDLKVELIRGNVDTRLRRVAEGVVDGVVLAAAGLKRLGRESEVAEWLDPGSFVPAVGQGALAVQVRATDVATARLVSRIDDSITRACALAERAVAIAVQASCSTAIGAHARIEKRQIEINSFMLIEDGISLVRAEASGAPSDGEALGAAVGMSLLMQGGVRQ